MTASYSVVQYIPDPVTGERINIGVFVFGSGRVLYRFVDDWEKVRAFGREDIEYLRSFVRDAASLNEHDLQKIISSWSCSIQFTATAGSILTHEELLKDVANRYLQGYATTSRSSCSPSTN